MDRIPLSKRGIRHYYLFIFLVNPVVHLHSLLLIINFVNLSSNCLKTHSIMGFLKILLYLDGPQIQEKRDLFACSILRFCTRAGVAVFVGDPFFKAVNGKAGLA